MTSLTWLSEVLHKDLPVFNNMLPTNHCFFTKTSPKDNPKKG